MNKKKIIWTTLAVSLITSFWSTSFAFVPWNMHPTGNTHVEQYNKPLEKKSILEKEGINNELLDIYKNELLSYNTFLLLWEKYDNTLFNKIAKNKLYQISKIEQSLKDIDFNKIKEDMKISDFNLPNDIDEKELYKIWVNVEKQCTDKIKDLYAKNSNYNLQELKGVLVNPYMNLKMIQNSLRWNKIKNIKNKYKEKRKSENESESKGENENWNYNIPERLTKKLDVIVDKFTNKIERLSHGDLKRKELIFKRIKERINNKTINSKYKIIYKYLLENLEKNLFDNGWLDEGFLENSLNDSLKNL